LDSFDVSSARRFGRFAWWFLAYLLAVIAFGAWVRISGSGAGCGTHWPLCQGAVIPESPGSKTVIEFTHRITSGLSGVLGIALVVWARRVSLPVFRWSLATMLFLLIEGFIGAVLVKKELVAGDASMSRAVVIGLHLTNTLLLTACAATAAWLASRREEATAATATIPRRGLLLYALGLLVLSNVTGAITALGDTLFPVQPALDGGLWAKLRDEISLGHHFLVRLRAIHPVVAVFAAGLAGWALFDLAGRSRLARWGLASLGAQMGLGLLNVALGAPGWMQIAHLVMAQLVWITTWLAALEWSSSFSFPATGRKAPHVV
jgi:heme A synthase